MRAVHFVLVLALLSACSSTPARTDGGGTTDTGPRADTGGGMDSGPVGTPVTIAQLVNAADPAHPADATTVTVTGPVVALSPRLFISQSMTSGRCLFAIWVGTAAGGDYSGIEVVDSFAPMAGMDCFTTPPNLIPNTVLIGDAITTLAGRFMNFCPAGATCPTDTAQEISATAFAVGAAGPPPTATDVAVADIAGMGTTLGPRNMALQGALVHLTGAVLQVAPSAANFNVMMVSDGASSAPTIGINISRYVGVGCQRTALSAMTAGAAVGDITGLLAFSFGQWVIQPRQGADLPGVLCAAADAGPG